MKITLFSMYFSPSISRRLGRKIHMDSARNFSDGRLEEILKSLHVTFSVRDGRYPRTPWIRSKIYDVESEMRKSTLIKTIERKLA